MDGANMYAGNLVKEFPILEYGICVLNHFDQKFQTFSKEEMEFYYAEIEDIIQRYREQKSIEISNKKKKVTVDFVSGMSFKPNKIYGTLIMSDGTTKLGSLSGLDELTIMQTVQDNDQSHTHVIGEGTNLKFLSSNWNESE